MPDELRVGAREIEELEDAERAAAGRVDRLHAAQPVLVDEHRFASLDLSHELRADEIQRARLGRDDPIIMNATEHERAEAERIAECDQRPLRDRDDRVGPFEPPHRVRNRLVERRVVVRDQRRDHLAVGGRAQRDAGGTQLLAQQRLVDEIAVVAERDRARAAVLHERLRIRPLRRARRRVARVPDRDLAAKSVAASARRTPASRARDRASPSGGPAPRPRCRPTPARDAAARRARST